MLCKRCMTVMGTGTTYEQRKDGRLLTRRFRKCKKCGEEIYIKESTFPECMEKVTKKRESK